MENYQKQYPHIAPEMAQTLQEIAASPDQWKSSDAAAKSQIDTTLTRYQLEPGNKTIVVIGTSGAGKSATANTLLGKKEVFKEGGSAVAMTKEFQVEKTDIDGIQLTVVDTPGAWNTKIPAKVGEVDIHLDDISYIIVVNMASPRFGHAELDCLKTLKGQDGKAVLTPGRCMVVLTHADSALQQSSLKKYIEEIQGDPLHELLTEHVNGKVLAINNSATTEYEQTRHRQAVLMNTMVAMDKSPPLGLPMLKNLPWMMIPPFLENIGGSPSRWMMIKTFLLLLYSFLICVLMALIWMKVAVCSCFEYLKWPKEDKTIKTRRQ